MPSGLCLCSAGPHYYLLLELVLSAFPTGTILDEYSSVRVAGGLGLVQLLYFLRVCYHYSVTRIVTTLRVALWYALQHLQS